MVSRYSVLILLSAVLIVNIDPSPSSTPCVSLQEDLVSWEQLETPETPSRGIYFTDFAGLYTYTVTVAGNHAYVGGTNFRAVVDITDPTNPEVIARQPASGRAAMAVEENENFTYWAYGEAGLAIINSSDPAILSTPLFYDTLGDVRSVAIGGNSAFIADGRNGLLILNISNPTILGAALRLSTRGWAEDVAIQGDYVYVGDWENGLAIIDISDLTAPGIPIYRAISGETMGVEVSENFAFLSAGENGVAIIDVSNRSNPGEPTYRTTTGVVLDVVVAGNHAFVADGRSGLAIIDVRNPLDPGEPVYRSTTGDAFAVAVQGNYAYIAAGHAGLVIIDWTLVVDADGDGFPDGRDPAPYSYFNPTGLIILLEVAGTIGIIAFVNHYRHNWALRRERKKYLASQQDRVN